MPKCKCPWCPKTVPAKEYAEHLLTHYKKEGGKLVGPFPAGIKTKT